MAVINDIVLTEKDEPLVKWSSKEKQSVAYVFKSIQPSVSKFLKSQDKLDSIADPVIINNGDILVSDTGKSFECSEKPFFKFRVVSNDNLEIDNDPVMFMFVRQDLEMNTVDYMQCVLKVLMNFIGEKIGYEPTTYGFQSEIERKWIQNPKFKIIWVRDDVDLDLICKEVAIEIDCGDDPGSFGSFCYGDIISKKGCTSIRYRRMVICLLPNVAQKIYEKIPSVSRF